MTPNRARYLINNLLPGGAIRRAFHLPGGGDSIHGDGMTRAEFVQAKEYWATMPGGSTFFSALCEIARMDDLPEAGGGPGGSMTPGTRKREMARYMIRLPDDRTSELFEAAGDRYMSGWVATCVHNGTRFFATEDGTYTDCLRRAAWRRWPSDADKVAQAAVGPGFQMVAESVATVLGDIP